MLVIFIFYNSIDSYDDKEYNDYMNDKKYIKLIVSQEVHKDIKLKAFHAGKNMSQYILDCVEIWQDPFEGKTIVPKSVEKGDVKEVFKKAQEVPYKKHHPTCPCSSCKPKKL